MVFKEILPPGYDSWEAFFQDNPEELEVSETKAETAETFLAEPIEAPSDKLPPGASTSGYMLRVLNPNHEGFGK